MLMLPDYQHTLYYDREQSTSLQEARWPAWHGLQVQGTRNASP